MGSSVSKGSLQSDPAPQSYSAIYKIAMLGLGVKLIKTLPAGSMALYCMAI